MDKPEFVPSCGTCRYRSDGPHVNADRGTAEFPDTMFACKRRAPVVTGGMMSNTMTIWPMVTKTDYCGEYESSEAWAAAQSQPAAEPVGDEGLVELIARAICENNADEIVQGGDVVGQPVDMPAWMLYQFEARRVAAALSTPDRAHD